MHVEPLPNPSEMARLLSAAHVVVRTACVDHLTYVQRTSLGSSKRDDQSVNPLFPHAATMTWGCDSESVPRFCR